MTIADMLDDLFDATQDHESVIGLRRENALLAARLFVAECERDYATAMFDCEVATAKNKDERCARFISSFKALANARMALTHLREGNMTMAARLTEMARR